MSKKDKRYSTLLTGKNKNWSKADIESTLRSYGFVQGKPRHTTFWRHEVYKDIKVGLPNRDILPPVYVKEVRKAIDKVIKRENEKQRTRNGKTTS